MIFPNYYMTVPEIVGQYLKKVKIEADYIFTLCSYGSIEDGAVRALQKCNKILEEKHEINYSNTVLMVDNFLPTFDMKEEKEIKNDEDIDERIRKINEDITNRKQRKISSFIDDETLHQDKQLKDYFQNLLKIELTENECTHAGYA